MICEKCGTDMQFKQNGHSICWICNNCGEAIASTCFEAYEIDLIEYRILLSSSFKSNANILKLISSIANCNYIEAKELISNAPKEIFHGKAVEVKAIKEKLEKANIDFKIEPEYPY